jgi:hypothetical protein
VLNQVVRTPRSLAQLVSREWAGGILRCSETELADVCRAYGAEFDAFDVWNIGLHSRSGKSRPEYEMLYTRRLLQDDWVSPLRFDIAAVAECPRGNECAGGSWTAPLILDVVWTTVDVDARARWIGSVTRAGKAATVRSRTAAGVWRAALATYRFHYTHPDLENGPAARDRRVATVQRCRRHSVSILPSQA